jgi:NAD(P)-dependent dehydrogenase (short-subunit alcohol dehydrogenase family)
MELRPRLHIIYPNPRHGAFVVIGSGPGTGSHVAALFAQNGFERVVLMSRNEQRLSDDAVVVRSCAPNAVVDIVRVDLVQTANVDRALQPAFLSLAASFARIRCPNYFLFNLVLNSTN